MQNLVHIYEANSPLIKKFIISTLHRLHFKDVSPKSYRQLHNTLPSLELMYACDEELVQTSANISDAIEDIDHIGQDRSYLVESCDFKTRYCVSEPYISGASGYLCITVIYKSDDGYIFLDFRLRTLLERFHLIEANTRFRQLSRFSYSLIGGGLLMFGLFVALYGLGSFGFYLFSDEAMSLEVVFKPVIALTLGLAVFDLGKTIYEQEVLPKTQNISESFNPKSLITFIASIVIALLIEALLIVFKIAINNYQDLHYAAVLIVSISLLLFVFGRFIPVKKEQSSSAKSHAE